MLASSSVAPELTLHARHRTRRGDVGGVPTRRGSHSGHHPRRPVAGRGRIGRCVVARDAGAVLPSVAGDRRRDRPRPPLVVLFTRVGGRTRSAPEPRAGTAPTGPLGTARGPSPFRPPSWPPMIGRWIPRRALRTAQIRLPATAIQEPVSVGARLSRRRFLRAAGRTGSDLAAGRRGVCPGRGRRTGPTPGSAGPPRRSAAAGAGLAGSLGWPIDEPPAASLRSPPAAPGDGSRRQRAGRGPSGSSAAKAPRCRTRATRRWSRALVDGVKVFELTIEEIQHRIDAQKEPLAGPWLQRHLAGSAADRRRRRPRSRHLHEQPAARRPASTSMASGCRTRWMASRTSPRTRSSPASRSPTSSRLGRPARTCTTATTTRPTRSAAGCSARSSSSPAIPRQRYDRLYGATQDIVWISNDALGGFTINGRGFPATAPIVATLGDTIVDPLHERGQHDAPVASPRDADAGRRSRRLSARVRRVHVRHARRQPGRALGRRHQCDEPGAWAFHCHILQHAEGQDGMFGMVTALVVQEAAAARASGSSVVASAAHAAGSTALACAIPSIG